MIEWTVLLQRPQRHMALMKRIALLCTLIFSIQCSLKHPQRFPIKAKDVTLDVSSSEPYGVDVSTRRPYGMVVRVYQARDGYVITEVTDGSAIIWKADTHSCERVFLLPRDDGSPSRLLIVHTMSTGGTRSPFYYEKDGGHTGHNAHSCDPFWAPITESTFYSSFHKRAMKNSIFDSISVDITNGKTCDTYFAIDTPKLPFLVFASNIGYRIKRLFNGMMIWEASSQDEGCLYASFYPRESPILAYLMVSSDHGMHELYLHKRDYEWHEVTREDYLDEVSEAGLDPSTFSNKVTMDIRDVDRDIFQPTIYPVHERKYHLYIPYPGFTLVRVVDGPSTLWEASDGDYCLHVNISEIEGAHRICYIFINGPKNGRNVLYYAKNGGGWTVVEKEEYMAVLTDRHNPVYTHQGDGRIIMSSFRNRQGLRLTSYASTVDNSRGDIILIYGIRSHFISEFSASNMEWNYEHFGFPVSPTVSPLGGYVVLPESDPAEKHRHIFENLYTHGNVLEMPPRYEYQGGFIEALNRMGYNVYGYDHQSHGLSESQTEKRCHVKKFKDYIYDLLQFISIVRRGKFSDSSEKWDESIIFKNIHSDRKLILMGNSMGGNVVIQAVQEFYRHADSQAKFIDGLLGLSPMLNLECHIYNWKKVLSFYALRMIAPVLPEHINPYEGLLNNSNNFGFFLRYRDPMHYIHRTTFSTLNSLFTACNEVKRMMEYYPMDLPTLLIHSREDIICGIKGSREFTNVHLKESSVVKLVEFIGSLHYLTVPQAMFGALPSIGNWLNDLLSKEVVADDQQSDEF